MSTGRKRDRDRRPLSSDEVEPHGPPRKRRRRDTTVALNVPNFRVLIDAHVGVPFPSLPMLGGGDADPSVLMKMAQNDMVKYRTLFDNVKRHMLNMYEGALEGVKKELVAVCEDRTQQLDRLMQKVGEIAQKHIQIAAEQKTRRIREEEWGDFILKRLVPKILRFVFLEQGIGRVRICGHALRGGDEVAVTSPEFRERLSVCGNDALSLSPLIQFLLKIMHAQRRDCVALSDQDCVYAGVFGSVENSSLKVVIGCTNSVSRRWGTSAGDHLGTARAMYLRDNGIRPTRAGDLLCQTFTSCIKRAGEEILESASLENAPSGLVTVFALGNWGSAGRDLEKPESDLRAYTNAFCLLMASRPEETLRSLARWDGQLRIPIPEEDRRLRRFQEGDLLDFLFRENPVAAFSVENLSQNRERFKRNRRSKKKKKKKKKKSAHLSQPPTPVVPAPVVPLAPAPVVPLAPAPVAVGAEALPPPPADDPPDLRGTLVKRRERCVLKVLEDNRGRHMDISAVLKELDGKYRWWMTADKRPKNLRGGVGGALREGFRQELFHKDDETGTYWVD